MSTFFLRVLTIFVIIAWSLWTSRSWFFDKPIGEVFTVIKSENPREKKLPQDFDHCGTMVIEPVVGSVIWWNWSDPLSKPWSTQASTQLDHIPLKHTSVESHIAWFVSRTYVTQVFENTAEVPVEATYMFPLPNEAAVDFMEMKIGERVIEWTIDKKAVAEKRYQQATQQWKTASLLNQERPNLFTQKVANIMPGDRIEITISYFQSVAYEDGEYIYVFPMVVWPRYTPKSVKDTAKITSPTIPAWRTWHDIDVTIHIDGWVPIQSISSASHDLLTTRNSENELTLTLKNEWEIPNRDLVISYRLATDEKQVWALFHHNLSDDHGYMTLMVEPPSQPKSEEILSKEVVFVLDTSWSMQGRPIIAMKKAMKKAINSLNEWDTFNIIDFDSSVKTLFDTPQKITSWNKKKWLKYVDSLIAWWGTVMDRPLQHALRKSWGDDGRIRVVLVMTDGDIGNEQEILRLVTKELWENRIFVFGVDAAANRYLLDRMVEVGKWKATYILNDAEIEEKVDEFYASFESPLLTNISVDRGAVRVYDVLPKHLPDLYEWQPIRISAKYDVQGVSKDTVITIKWWQWDIPYIQELPVVFPKSNIANDSLKSLRWRKKVKEIYSLNRFENNTSLQEEVTQLWLEYRIMTEYTSFIAIDEQVRNQWWDQVAVVIPKYQVEGKQQWSSQRWSSFVQQQSVRSSSRSPNTYEIQSEKDYQFNYSTEQLSIVGGWSSSRQRDSILSIIRGSIHWLAILLAGIWWLMLMVWSTRIYLLRNSERDITPWIDTKNMHAKYIRNRWVRILLWSIILWFLSIFMFRILLNS